MKWLDKKLKTGFWSKKGNLLIIGTTVLVFLFSFPSRTVVRFGQREIFGLAEQTVLKSSEAGAYLSSWGQALLLQDGSVSHNKAISIIGLWAVWGGTFAILVPFLLFIAMYLIIKFRERQINPPVLPPDDLALFVKIKREVSNLYFRANRINYIVVTSIVLGMGVILTILQASIQLLWPLSPILIRTSIGTYIFYSGLLYLYFLFYKGFSKQRIISTIDHYIGLQQGLSTTMAVDFEQSQSTMYHLLLGSVSKNFQHTKLTRLFPWRFPELTGKNLLANLTALTLTFCLAQASIPALASISRQSGLSVQLVLDNIPLNELLKIKSLNYQFAQESLIIKNLSQEILKEDNSPLTKSLAEELMKLATDLSQIAMETDNFYAFDNDNLKERLFSGSRFIHDQFSKGKAELNQKDGSPEKFSKYKKPVTTKNTPASRIKKTAAILATQVDQLIKELLIHKIKHYDKKNQTPSLKTEKNPSSTSVFRTVPKKSEKKLKHYNYKKWKDSLKLKKMASGLNRISRNLMAALATDKRQRPSERKFFAFSSPADKISSQAGKSQKHQAGSADKADTLDTPENKKQADQRKKASKQPYKDERILISHQKLKLVKSELEEAQLLLKDWSNEWQHEPLIGKEIRASGSRIRELNDKLAHIIEQQELYLEGGKIPKNIRVNSVPKKLVASDKRRLAPPKGEFRKMAGELGKISRKIFRAGENLGNLPDKSSSIEVVHALGGSVPKLAESLRKQPKTVDRLIKELGKISETLRNRNWGLAGNPALFNPDSQNKLALKVLSKKLKEIASKSEARKLGKELGRIAERFQDSGLPEIAIPPKRLGKLSSNSDLTKAVLKAQTKRLKEGAPPPSSFLLAGQAGFTPPKGLKELTSKLTWIAQKKKRERLIQKTGPPQNRLLADQASSQLAGQSGITPLKGLKELTPKLTGIAQKKRMERLIQKTDPPQNRLLADQASFPKISGDFSPPPGVKPPNGNPNKAMSGSYSEQIVNNKTKLAGGLKNREWFRPQTAEAVPSDYSGGSKGIPPRQPKKGSVSQNTAGRRSGGNSKTNLAQVNLQPAGQLRNQDNVRDLEKIWKNSSLAGIRKGEFGSGPVPHDRELIKKLRKRYGAHQQSSKIMGQGKTRELFDRIDRTSSPDFGKNASRIAEVRRTGRPNTSGKPDQSSAPDIQFGNSGMMGSNNRGMKEKPLANRQLVEQLRSVAPERSQPGSMPEMTPSKGDRGSGKGNNRQGGGKLTRKQRLLNQSLTASQMKSNPFADRPRPELANSTFPRQGPNSENLNSRHISGETSLSNMEGLLLTTLPKNTTDSKVSRTSLAESLSGEIKHRQSLGNRSDLRNQLSPNYRSHKNWQSGITTPPDASPLRNGQNLTAIPNQNQKALKESVKTEGIATREFSDDFKRFKQKVDKLNKQLKSAQTFSQIKDLSQEIAREFSEFRSGQLSNSQPPELLAQQERSFNKLASLNSQIQSMPANMSQKTAGKNPPDLKRAARNQNLRKDRRPSLEKLTNDIAETSTKLLNKANQGLFPLQPAVSGKPGPSSGTNRQTAKNRELKNITKEMSKIATGLLGKINPQHLSLQASRLADLSKQLGNYQELGKNKKRLPSELSKTIKTLGNLGRKLADNLIRNYRPQEANLLANQLLQKAGQLGKNLANSERQPKSPVSARADQTGLSKFKQKGKRPPGKVDQQRFLKASPVLKYGSKLTDFNPATREPSPGSLPKKDIIKQIKRLTATMEFEQDPEKIKNLAHQLGQLAELLNQRNQTSFQGKGNALGKNDTAAAGKQPNKQMADRVDRLSGLLQNLGDTPEMNRLKSEFDRVSNHMRNLPKMIPSQKGDKGLSERNHRAGSNKSNKRKGNKLPLQATMEKRMQDKVSSVLNRMDRFIDKMSGFYNQELSKNQSGSSYNKEAKKKKEKKTAKDTASFSKEGPIKNTLSMETNLTNPETFRRIIKRLRSQRNNISKLKMKLPVFRSRKLDYSLQTEKRSPTKQPAGLEGIRFSSLGEYFPGVSAPAPLPSGGSNLNRIYMDKNQGLYLKLEINIKDNLKGKARLLPTRSLSKKSKSATGLKLSKSQTLDHSTLTQDVPPVYRDIIKQIFTRDEKIPLPAASQPE